MSDSQDQPRQGGREAHFPVARTNNSQASSKPTRSGGTSNPASDGLGFDEWLEMRKKLVELQGDEAQARLLESFADLAKAKAEEVGHKATAEPVRQKMSLWERGVKLFLEASLTLTIIGLAIAMFVVSPWLSLGLPPAAFAAWMRFGKEEDHKTSSNGEGDP